MKIVLIDNRDSFVYNLMDAFAGHECTVFRNTVAVADVLATEPDVICLSPGPGHPREAGNLMEIVDATYGRVPLLGICLGFQAILEHLGEKVVPCGPMHGVADSMKLTPEGYEFFGGETKVARYHSLGSVSVTQRLRTLGTCSSEIGDVIMAAYSPEDRVLGLQFHPESILSPTGPHILENALTRLGVRS